MGGNNTPATYMSFNNPLTFTVGGPSGDGPFMGGPAGGYGGAGNYGYGVPGNSYGDMGVANGLPGNMGSAGGIPGGGTVGASDGGFTLGIGNDYFNQSQQAAADPAWQQSQVQQQQQQTFNNNMGPGMSSPYGGGMGTVASAPSANWATFAQYQPGPFG
jgi:hypothetical protein